MTAKTNHPPAPKLRFPEFNGGWEETAISEKLTKVIDYRGKAPPKADSGVPLITARNVRDGFLDFTADEYIEEQQYDTWMRRGIPNANDVLFTTEAPLGNVALFPSSGRYALGQRIITLQTDSSRCHSIFLFHLLKSETARKAIDAKGTGSTAKGIKSKVFVQIPLGYPTLPEQRKIADFLTAVDGRIGQLSQKKALLEDYKKGVMQQLFTQALRFKDDHGNDFPEWEEKKLGEVSRNVMYGMNAAATEFDGVTKYIRITDIDESSNRFKPDPVTSPDQPAEDRYKLRRGDIVFARTGASVGKSYLYDESDGNLAFAGFLIRFSISEDVANPYFIFLQTLSENYWRWVKVNSMRSGQPGINAEEYKTFPFQLPSLPEQTKIANFLTALDRKIESVSQQITHTQTFKKGLLQQMFV